MPGKLIRLADKEKIKIEEYELPEVGSNSLLTEVVQANICGSDMSLYRGELPAYGICLGHEGVFRVHSLGENVETDYAGEPVEEGDLIVSVYYITCHKCYNCQRGEFNLCQNAYKNMMKSPEDFPHFHGTFATNYYIHHNQYFYKVPDSIPPSSAASANCAFAQMTFGIDSIGLSAGDNVLVQGAGGLGLFSIAYAKEHGANVIVIEGVDKRIKRAEEFGADHVIDFREHDNIEKRSEYVKELTNGIGADLGIEVAGIPEVFVEGIEYLRDGGRYLEVGNNIPGRKTEFDPGSVTRKGINILTMVRYNPWYLKRTLDFLEQKSNKYPFESIIDEKFSLSNAKKGLEISEKKEATRVGLIPE